MDVSNFFTSIDHNVLYAIFSKFISRQSQNDEWKNEMLWLGEKIIFHQPQKDCHIKSKKHLWEYVPKHKSLFYVSKGKGLPIGNYSSQFFANLYLNELDYFVKQVLKCKCYVRYVDDFVIIGRDDEELVEIPMRVDEFLQERLQLSLNTKKTKLKPIAKGVDFLGYIVKPEYVLVRQRVVNVCKGKLHKSAQECLQADGQKELEQKLSRFLSQASSYSGHFIHANSFNLRSNLFGLVGGEI